MTAGRVLRMRRALDAPPPPPVWPHGVRVRPWADGDEVRVHALLVEGYRRGGGEVPDLATWRVTFPGDPEFDASACLVAEDEAHPEGALAGVALCWSTAFVKDLVVAERWRRRGLGEALLRAAFAVFRARGHSAVELKVDAENPSGAVRLYRRAGFAESTP